MALPPTKKSTCDLVLRSVMTPMTIGRNNVSTKIVSAAGCASFS
jgi:hypothetical protein